MDKQTIYFILQLTESYWTQSIFGRMLVRHRAACQARRVVTIPSE